MHRGIHKNSNNFSLPALDDRGDKAQISHEFKISFELNKPWCCKHREKSEDARAFVYIQQQNGSDHGCDHGQEPENKARILN